MCTQRLVTTRLSAPKSTPFIGSDARSKLTMVHEPGALQKHAICVHQMYNDFIPSESSLIFKQLSALDDELSTPTLVWSLTQHCTRPQVRRDCLTKCSPFVWGGKRKTTVVQSNTSQNYCTSDCLKPPWTIAHPGRPAASSICIL